ncbi:hypothetical protein A3860_09555 [Niastella vici]|uniref:Uncharacterized protein n=1 Tax=Niastella vici TaxID=1703345 RepID=A0A1V9FEP0_9BACT|nr:hypothetical protein [Niastella vici]OQP56820.1 hypothetical protein A3860_09555 [Niastella vici]
MKHLLSIIFLLVLSFSTTAQRRISFYTTKINKDQFDKCGKVSYLVANAQIRKKSGSLRIPIVAKAAKVFKDDSSDRDFHEFKYLGDVKGTKLSLVQRIEYNDEEFYLLNRLTGTIDTLIGQPVFAQNMKNFVCVNNPGTDEKQQIQVCEMIDGRVKTRVYLDAIANTIIEFVTCVNRNSFLAEDNYGKYWKIHFKLSDE